MRPRSRRGPKAAWLALGVGLGYAAVSAYWAVGGTALLATVGGVFERAGRSGGAGVELLLWFVVAVKVGPPPSPWLRYAGCDVLSGCWLGSRRPP